MNSKQPARSIELKTIRNQRESSIKSGAPSNPDARSYPGKTSGCLGESHGTSVGLCHAGGGGGGEA